MKQSPAKLRRPFRASLIFLLTSFSLAYSVQSSAHIVNYYSTPCFLQGASVSVGVNVTYAGAGTYYHWQYRTAAGNAWVWLSNGNNTINGRTFSISNASQVSGVANYTANLVINNVGSPAYTNQLDNIELRVIMTDGLDPQTNTGVSAWGGEEFINAFEAKYTRLISKPATNYCYSNCTGNVLVANPAVIPPPAYDYFGGFEMGTGAGTLNFCNPGTYGTTSRAATDITQWIGTNSGTNPLYRIIGNPDSANIAFRAFAPHSGNQMMVISRNNNASNRLWYRTVAVSNPAGFYNGQVTFKAWFAKVDPTDACMILEVKGATMQAGSAASFSGNSVSQTITGTAGNWVQLSLSVTLPFNTYKKLEFSIHGCNNNITSVAIDDICLIEPVAGALPVVLSQLKGNYADGAAHLTWSTEQESNSNYFEVERSSDGVNFTNAGKLAASGNSSKTVQYKFDDVNAAAGNNYYRLKMVDVNGRMEWSNTVLVKVNIRGIFVTAVYPSPFTDIVNINIASENAGTATVNLRDITGRTIAMHNEQVAKGTTRLSLTGLGKLANGMYIVTVNCNGILYTEKLVK
jgi:hypothetical protein